MDAPIEHEAAPPRHVNPRVKGSYRLFSIAHPDGSTLWLNGAQLDAYALSRRWVRLGIELEGGAGGANVLSSRANIAYGLFGMGVGIQYPWRVTPFVEGRAVGGVLHAELQDPLTVGSVTLNGTSATTWIYGGGIETGVELYAYKRFYVSAAIGWVRTIWRGPDLKAMLSAPAAGLQTTNLVGDSFTLKIGIGI